MSKDLLVFGKQAYENGKPQKQLLTYNCNYCSYRFKQYVRKLSKEENKAYSTQVCCPQCGNMLKTWE